ncbi:MAG: hypothetical protein PW735_08100 [Acidobacteriaceae bacterium]|nr:hypothetical protein [Acidobacteriaceae bacterium]
MTEQTQAAPNEPVLNKKPFDPKGVMQRHSKPIVYGGFCLLVVIALLFSSRGKTSASAKQQAKQNSPQPLVQDNTENNVADLKSQLAHQQQTLDQAHPDPALANDHPPPPPRLSIPRASTAMHPRSALQSTATVWIWTAG